MKQPNSRLRGAGILSAAFLAAVGAPASAQNVGIGTTTPQSKLSVNAGLAVGGPAYTSTPGTVAPLNGALIEGRVGIGMVQPQVNLHVDGTVYVAPPGVTGAVWSGSANQDAIALYPGGLIGAQRAGVGACLALSKPIGGAVVGDHYAGFYANETLIGSITRTAGGVAFDEVMKILVSDYNFKSNPGTDETGFIAQQLHKVFPDAVSQGGEDATKNPWTVDYGRITPVLVKSVQELNAKVETQEQEKAELRAAITSLNAENEALKARLDELGTLAAKVEALERLAVLTPAARNIAAVSK